jgi:hypothetical protein
LAGAGLLRMADGERRELVRSPDLAAINGGHDRERLAESAELLGGAERKLRMALLLAQGGFADEAVPVLTECLTLATNARNAMNSRAANGEPTVNSGSAHPYPPAAATEPAAAVATPSLLDLASSVERTLAAVRHRLAASQAAA